MITDQRFLPPLRALAALLLPSPAAMAAPVDFVREVRPIFEKHCYECHGEKKEKPGLRLDVKAEALRGGAEHAPDIIAGQAKESPLVQMVTSADKDERMPPRKSGGDGLSPAE